MSETSLSRNFRSCATCALWGGMRRANSTRSIVAFEQEQKGECLGGGFDHLKMSPRSTCSSYRQWLE